MNKIDRAKLFLAKRFEWLAPIIASHDIRFDPDCRAEGGLGWNDGRWNIGLDTNYFLSLTDIEQASLILHEVLHKFRKHFVRRGARDSNLWNQAADYQIHADFVDHYGMPIPPGGLYETKYRGMSAEAIYKALQNESPGQQPAGDVKGGCKGQRPLPGGYSQVIVDISNFTPEEAAQEESELDQRIENAIIYGRKAGRLPGHVEEQVQALRVTRLRWDEILRTELNRSPGGRANYRRINNRRTDNRVNSGRVLKPTFLRNESGNVAIICDTSISTKDIAQKMVGIMSDLTMLQNRPVQLISVDTKVQDIQTFPPGRPIRNVTLKGRGGTDFRPGFEVIAPRTKTIVYLTDGECHHFPKRPLRTEVFWVVLNNKGYRFNPPFGKVIKAEI